MLFVLKKTTAASTTQKTPLLLVDGRSRSRRDRDRVHHRDLDLDLPPAAAAAAMAAAAFADPRVVGAADFARKREQSGSSVAVRRVRHRAEDAQARRGAQPATQAAARHHACDYDASRERA